MNKCPCGCGRLVKPGKIYAAIGCNSRFDNPSSTPESKLKISKKLKGRAFSVAWRKRLSIAAKNRDKATRVLSSEACKKISERMKAHPNRACGERNAMKRPGMKEKLSRLFHSQSKEWHEARLKKCLAVIQRGPNSFEIDVMHALEKSMPGKFKYVGNGEIVINGRSADFIDEQNKVIVLAHGIYWHLKKKGLQNTLEEKKRIAEEDARPFVTAGYEVRVVWEDEFRKGLVRL